MSRIADKDLEGYAAEVTTPASALHERLAVETWDSIDCPQMQVGAIEGRLLTILVKLCGAKRAVEIGTFTGYSGLHIAEGLPEDGRLITCDIDPVATEVAQRYWDESPWGAKIALRLGRALDTLAELEGPIDFAFIDADKANYIAYWEALLPKMPSGGLIVADNVLWSGRVLDPPETHSDCTAGIVAFNTHVAADDRVEQVLLTVRDGITIARKK
jgi:caffeoyl-CoA O-methyltransferase